MVYEITQPALDITTNTLYIPFFHETIRRRLCIFIVDEIKLRQPCHRADAIVSKRKPRKMAPIGEKLTNRRRRHFLSETHAA